MSENVTSPPGGHGGAARDPLQRPSTPSALFPGRSRLPVTAPWWAAILVAMGGSLMIVVSLGAEVADIGNLSIWVWVGTAAIGGLQCFLIAEMASRFPERAGGTAQFAYRALPGGSRSLGALSAWCYWFAWTPGIAVNLILAATFLRDLLLPGVNAVLLAGLIGAVLYIITALGLRLATVINACLALVAAGVILIVVVGPLLRPGAFHLEQVIPAALPSGAPDDFGSIIALVLKWGFVATWSSYAAEMASTVCAEIRQPERHMKRIMTASATICFVAFSAIPIMLFGLLGAGGLGDPFKAFTAAGRIALGPVGETFVGVGLAAVLILAAETFIIGSSRTVYQMSQDGHIPRFFGKINKRGAPVGSIAWDAVVIGIMLVVFGTHVVEVVAAANFGYLIVFVLMPIAYLVLRRHPGGRAGGLRLPRPFIIVALVLAAFNAILLVFGGSQWGPHVVAVGVVISLIILPVSAVTHRMRRRVEDDVAATYEAPVEPVSAGTPSP
ncbi:APC family permease [Dactylosporangium sp. CA-092794]|uniref:APC family permease n=1 Tax=Dactylosporangium sp. CA-092794 TaxID=3239929 RepID=UPI003D89C47B